MSNIHTFCYFYETPVLRYHSHRIGSDQCDNTTAPEEETLSKMLKRARPIAEATVISVAIVIAALAVPAAILYAAV